LLLRNLAAAQLDRFRDLSARYSKIFLELESETIATYIESIYHSLGADPKSGGRRMLEYGLRLKSEPLFQWDALDRLVTNADEQDARGVLDEECQSYSGFLKLFVPRLRQPPSNEIALLSQLSDAVPDNEIFVAEVQLRLGYDELAIGKIENARKTLSEANILCGQAQWPIGKIEALRGLARIALRQDNYAEACRYFEDARTLAVALGLTASSAQSAKGMAEIDFLQGRYVPAESKFAEAIEQFRDTGARLGEANTRVSLAQLLALQHRFDEASDHVRSAQNIYQPLRQDLGLGNCAKALGIICYEQGSPVEALGHFAEADSLYARAGNKTGLAYSNLVKAAALLALNKADDAERALLDSGKILSDLGDRYGVAMVEREAGRVAQRKGQIELSFKLLTHAMAVFEVLPNPVERATTFIAIVPVAAQLGFPLGYDKETMISIARLALHIFAENGLPHRQQEISRWFSVPYEAHNSLGA
jgi:tetratricopeptide (TPR) repeat protein